MSELEQYRIGQALEEAEKMKLLVDSGKAADYTAAAEMVSGLENDPKELLLTPEETAEVAFADRYSYQAESGSQKVFVFGTKHTNRLDEVQDFEELLEEQNPDVVLTEVASSLWSYYPTMTLEEILEMSPEEIIKGQEQMYFTWLAAKQGKKVQSWDIPQTEIIKRTINKDEENGPTRYSEDDAVAWLATYGLRKLYEDGKVKMMETADDLYTELYRLIIYACPGIENDNELHLNLTQESIDRILIATTNKSLAEYVRRANDSDDYDVDKTLVTQTSNSSFASAMNDQRDHHAMDIIQKAKDDGVKNIFITAGGSHAVVWEKAIKHIYK